MGAFGFDGWEITDSPDAINSSPFFKSNAFAWEELGMILSWIIEKFIAAFSILSPERIIVFPPPPFLGDDQRNFRASLFVDIGNVFEDIGDFSYSDLRGSYGIQANFRTPVGAVSLGFVDAFKSKDGDDTKPVIFSLGGAFWVTKNI